VGHIHSDDIKDNVIVTASSSQGNNVKNSKILVPIYERNRPLWRRRHVRKDNIKKDFKEAGYKNVSLV
jgi:hypothetical protein